LFELPQDIHKAMSPDIPEKQWAQVIEKTGGPVEYKQIPVAKPGPDEVYAIQICMLSTVTGH